MSTESILPSELAQLCEGDKVHLIDVRTPIEYQEVHAQPARNIPLDQLDPQDIVQEFEPSPQQPLYVICRSGARGAKACEALRSAGVSDVRNVDGGTLAWDAAGLPVRRGKKMVSLERQVRIAAGALVLSGVLLSRLHPYWIGLSGFVGAGLMFAGITDTCAMGMLLAKMPWNKVKSCSTPAAGSDG